MTQIFYDKAGDVLYLSFGQPRIAISEELDDDILLRLDPETGEIVGLTVLNLSIRYGNRETAEALPVSIEAHKTA